MNQVNPWQALWNSRKVRIALCDAFFSTLVVLITALLSPENAETAMIVVAIWQPVFVAVIGGIAYEDGMEKAAGMHVSQQPESEAMA